MMLHCFFLSCFNLKWLTLQQEFVGDFTLIFALNFHVEPLVLGPIDFSMKLVSI